MVDENSKQMGQNSAALLDSVAAVLRRVSYIALTHEWEDLPEFWRVWFATEDGKPRQSR